MSRNGSGTYSLPAGNPVVTNTTISSTTHNNTNTDIATALTQSLAYDGQTVPIANLPMGTYRHTGVGNGVASTDYAAVGQLQSGYGVYVSTVAGTANAITLTPVPAISAYAAGQAWRFIVGTTNTSSVTIATSGLATRAAKKRASGGKVALVPNDLIAGLTYKVYDDGTDYVVEGVRPYSQGADIASASTINLDTATGDYVHVTGTTSITAITLKQGEERTIVFDGILTFTNGASLLLPTSANITTAANDVAVVRGEASSVVRCLSYLRKDGTSLIAASVQDNSIQDFRLTLTSVTPVTPADVTAAATIYAAPYKGTRIALYDGSSTWNIRTSAQFSGALGTLSSGKPYDVFCYDNSTVPTLEFLAWTNDTTRATALAYQDGVLVKSGATTRRYLGTFYTTSTTTTEDSAANRYLYNYYNRVEKSLLGTFSTGRSTGSTTYVELSSEIRVNWFMGVSEDAVFASFVGTNTGSTDVGVGNAIAFDSATVATAGFENCGAPVGGGYPTQAPIAGYKQNLAIGLHYATILGKVSTSAAATWSAATAASSAKCYLHIGVMT